MSPSYGYVFLRYIGSIKDFFSCLFREEYANTLDTSKGENTSEVNEHMIIRVAVKE